MPPPQARPRPSARTLDRAGAAVTAVFALPWALTGAMPLSSDGTAALVRSAALVVTVAALVAAFVCRTGRGPAHEVDLPADWRRRFDRIGAAQALSIALTVVVLLVTGGRGLIPASVCLIVGLHFFPLAAVVRQRYRAVATVLCLVAVSGFAAFLAAGGAASTSVVGGGAALALWTTSFQHTLVGLGVPAGR